MVPAVSPANAARLRIAAVLVCGIVMQTTFGTDLRIEGVAPDFMLLLAVAGGLAAGPGGGAFIGFSAGLLADLSLTATPLGVYALSWCLVGFAVGWARLNVLPEGRPVQPLVGLAATAGGLIVLLVVGALSGQGAFTAAGKAWLVRVGMVEAAWNAVLVIPVTAVMRRAARGTRGADRLGRTDALVTG
ncbi:MAG: rod shape-determining protein MreD [Actinomycetota bacterium]|nr:rod shape-determining protein MreD [Actinomycetota bacterium]